MFIGFCYKFTENDMCYGDGVSGVATGGSGGSMSRGPRAPGGPRAAEPGHEKIKQENNRHTSEKTNNQSLYRDSCVHLNGQYRPA